MNYRPKTLEELWEKILSLRWITESGCWRYLGCTNSRGYGQIHFLGKQYEVHRISAVINLGLDINNKREQSNHKEICQYHDCFNPDHLYKGNNSTNAIDTVRNKTHRESKKTHCPKGHEYNDKNTWISPNGWRQCRICWGLSKQVAKELEKT